MNKMLTDAIMKKDKFLQEHPNMLEYQKEIENILNKCNPKDRKEALGIMIGCKLNEFAEELYKIKDINERLYNG